MFRRKKDAEELSCGFEDVIIRWFILKTDKMVDVTEKKAIIRINLSTALFPFW